jgi:hypothetical protein
MRGPHDDEIKGPDPDPDRARKRREQFLRERFPDGIPPTEDAYDKETREADQKTEEDDQKTTREPPRP